MNFIKDFFKIEKPYTFEWGDIHTIGFCINVVLVLVIGLPAAYWGITFACIEFIRELFNKCRRVNSIMCCLAYIVLNSYFISIL